LFLPIAGEKMKLHLSSLRALIPTLVIAFLASCGGGSADLSGFDTSPPPPPNPVTPVDATPPKVLALTPKPDATDATPWQLVQVTFDDPLDNTSVNASTVLLYDGSSQLVAGTVTYLDMYQCAGIEPTTSVVVCGYSIQYRSAAPLLAATKYTAVLKSQIKNTSGTPLGSDVIWHFTTSP
jgi:hypothetical protein